MDVRETIRHYQSWLEPRPSDVQGIIRGRTSKQTVELIVEELWKADTCKTEQNILALVEDILKFRNGVSKKYSRNFSKHIDSSSQFYEYLETHITTEQRVINRQFLARFSYLTKTHRPILRKTLKFAAIWDPFSIPNLLQEIQWQSDGTLNWNSVKQFVNSPNYLHRWAIIAYLHKESPPIHDTKNFSKVLGMVEALSKDTHLFVATEAKWLFTKLKLERRYDMGMPKTKDAQKGYAKKLNPYRTALEDIQPAYSFEHIGYSYLGFLGQNNDFCSSPELIDAFLSCYWKKPLYTPQDFSRLREEMERILDKEHR
jgi:hypothetical protein